MKLLIVIMLLSLNTFSQKNIESKDIVGEYFGGWNELRDKITSVLTIREDNSFTESSFDVPIPVWDDNPSLHSTQNYTTTKYGKWILKKDTLFLTCILKKWEYSDLNKGLAKVQDSLTIAKTDTLIYKNNQLFTTERLLYNQTKTPLFKKQKGTATKQCEDAIVLDESNHTDTLVYKMMNKWDGWRLTNTLIHRSKGCGFMQCDGDVFSVNFFIDETGKATNIKWNLRICYNRPFKFRMKRKLSKSLSKIIFPEETRKKCYTLTRGVILKC